MITRQLETHDNRTAENPANEISATLIFSFSLLFLYLFNQTVPLFCLSSVHRTHVTV